MPVLAVPLPLYTLSLSLVRRESDHLRRWKSLWKSTAELRVAIPAAASSRLSALHIDPWL